MLGAFPLVLPDFPLKARKPSLDARKTNKENQKGGLDGGRKSLTGEQEGKDAIQATADKGKMGEMKDDIDLTNDGQDKSKSSEGTGKGGSKTTKVNKQIDDKSRK